MFFRLKFLNCISCVDNCDDQSSPPQFKYMIFLVLNVSAIPLFFACRMSCETVFLIFFLEQEILKQGFIIFFFQLNLLPLTVRSC